MPTHSQRMMLCSRVCTCATSGASVSNITKLCIRPGLLQLPHVGTSRQLSSTAAYLRLTGTAGGCPPGSSISRNTTAGCGACSRRSAQRAVSRLTARQLSPLSRSMAVGAAASAAVAEEISPAPKAQNDTAVGGKRLGVGIRMRFGHARTRPSGASGHDLRLVMKHVPHQVLRCTSTKHCCNAGPGRVAHLCGRAPRRSADQQQPPTGDACAAAACCIMSSAVPEATSAQRLQLSLHFCWWCLSMIAVAQGGTDKAQGKRHILLFEGADLNGHTSGAGRFLSFHPAV